MMLFIYLLWILNILKLLRLFLKLILLQVKDLVDCLYCTNKWYLKVKKTRLNLQVRESWHPSVAVACSRPAPFLRPALISKKVKISTYLQI